MTPRWILGLLFRPASSTKGLRPLNKGRKGFTRRLRVEQLESRDLLTTLPAGFQEDLVAGGLYEPTSMVVAPDGRLFISEKPFGVRVVQNGQLLTTPLLSLAVERGGERGVEGVVLDPGFATNGFFYVYYTHATATGSFDRLSRFTISATNPNIADPASERVLIDGIATTTPGYHNGGLMQFGADGKLYVGIGDTTFTALPQDLTELQGKILRIDPNGSSLIPSDNPFVNTAGARGEIWAYGFRNPFTGGMMPGTNRLFANDVGGDKWEEINEVVKGANYGWPLTEGLSTNPAYTNPVYTYAHDNGQGAAITGGVFYTGTNFPAAYAGKYFFSDYVRSFIKTYDAATGAVATFAPDAFIPVDIANAPDGSLYWLSLGTGSGTNGALYKVHYVVGNRAPTAVATATPTNGLPPLAVSFDASGSSDPDGDPLTYSWSFGDGTTGTGIQPTHSYAVSGTYIATLTANDGQTTGQSQPITISVGNSAPVPTISLPLTTTTYRAGDTISFSGSATDREDGALTASHLEWKVIFHHEQHFHPFIDSIAGVASGTFQIPLTGEVDPVQWYQIQLTATDSGGLQSTTFTDVFPVTSTFTLNSNVPGISLLLDGQPTPAGTTITGVVNMGRSLEAPMTQVVAGVLYQFTGWSDGGAAQHNIATPAASTTYTATYQPAINSASFAATPPTVWAPGVAQTYNVTITNNGTTTWQANGAIPTHLGVYFNGGSDAIYDWPSEPIRLSLPNDVAPGQSVTVPVTITAPLVAGTYVLRHRMVQENVQWFSQLLKTNTVVDLLQASYAATIPNVWPAGSSQTFPITVTNQGAEVWTAGGLTPVRLAAYFDAPSDLVGSWTAEPLRFALPSDLAPGQSATVNVTLAAPTLTGDHVLRYRMVKEPGTWSTALGVQGITVGTLSAQYSAATFPFLWNSGETKSLSITVTNTGDFTWQATGTHAVNLGAYFDATSDLPGTWPAEPPRFVLPANVAPGQSVTVPITITAPLLVGEHVLRIRLVKEQVWFSPLLAATVTVGTLSATYTTTAATSWGMGATKTFTTTITNTGNVIWKAGGATPVRLAVYFDGTSDAAGAWTTDPLRVALTSDVSPGQSQTVSVTITGPAVAGSFILRQRLVKEGVSWFDPPKKTTVSVAQAVLAASYTSTPPTTWLNGQTIPYSITLKNTGTQTWNRAGTNPVKLGIYFGDSRDAIGAWTTEPTRYLLPNDVLPGQSVTMTINVTAPMTAAGSYMLRARMLKDNVGWFEYFQKTPVVVQTLSASYSGTVPTTWTRGETKTYSVTVTNTGTATWNTSGTNAVKLGAYFGTASDAVGAWTVEPKRIVWPTGVSSVAPGQSVTLSVTMTAPTTAGSYILRHRMVKENVRWFNEMLKTSVTIP